MVLVIGSWFILFSLGELSEWFKEAVLKTVGGASLPGVRISHSPNLGTMAEPGLKQLLAKKSTYIVWRPEVQILLVPPTLYLVYDIKNENKCINQLSK